ncbi:peptide chain release factor N(5)-glutamine methyltransferase [Streptococcus parauberis]|uniref:peptide chain release factor N(5)-glutamine methyltransferase n=1 Tax=Streptococcus parauberis TaxID=1348 RepID=UPI00097873C4|nr:peptide chain release factor N(5)-glutamine methyltransferase [Streptococcus parauberis]ONH63310.1 Release factor glutamine methyltransferase [Streptococcus parauberis]PCH11643.1 Release factor glutamine methyltransferase [Streptococcus parauberis]PIO79822.1 Release factor glutamine methyltransferase [Streptococcus parauberis]PNY21336.1 Release factor glutamine methyltransferase [Streptococcus parauberis]POS68310.1 Release factor glutamine methyltransferase [Streptococcus parauberis]
MNYAQTISQLQSQLEAVGEDPENLIYVFKELKKWSTLDYLLHQNKEVSTGDLELFQSIMTQLKTHRSPQYITGNAYFRDLILSVDERVLIPRPETEELVSLILEEHSDQSLRVLDIGTGSGAIALGLKKERPNWQIDATDISLDALSLAQENGRALDLEINWLHSDLFSNILDKYDIIVSNPPYIAFEDKDEVGLNVWHSEPHLALFADDNGLAIYRAILEQASHYLTEDGAIYFEIGYKQGQDLKELAEANFPQCRVRLLQDYFGKDRMVVINHEGTDRTN